MTRQEKTERARELRDRGLTLRQIADELGYANHGSAWALLNPERHRENVRKINRKRRPAKREWERNNRAECPECGRLMQAGSKSPSHRPARCEHCRQLADRERVNERAEKIERWWAEGLSLQEIANRLGWTKGHLGVEMHRLRTEGYDLPYRLRRKARV